MPLEHVFRQLVAAYLGGADEFVVAERGGLRPATRELARTFARRTSGPQVVLNEADRVVLHILPDQTPADLTDELRGMYDLVARLEQTVDGYLTPGGPVDPTDLERRDDEVDRQAWLVERALGAGLAARSAGPAEVGTPSAVAALLLARALERIADHAVTLGTCAAQLSECSLPDEVRGALRSYHLQVAEYLRHSFRVVDAPDVVRANELLDTGDALHATHGTLTERFLVRGSTPRLTPIASASLGLALQSIDRTISYAQDVIQVGLDRAMAARIAATGSERTIEVQPARPGSGGAPTAPAFASAA